MLDANGSFEAACADLESRQMKYCPLVQHHKIVLGEVSNELYGVLQTVYGTARITQELQDKNGEDVFAKLDFRYAFSPKFFEGSNAPRNDVSNVKDVIVKGVVALASGADVCDQKSLDVFVDGCGSFEGTFEELFGLALDPAVEHIYTKSLFQSMKK